MSLQAPPDGDVDRSPSLLALFWTPYPVMLAIVIARITVRLKMRNFGPDDGLMVASFFLYTTGSVPLTLYALKGGVRHIFYIDPAEVPYLIKLNFISQPFGAVSAALGKLSVAFLVLRILGQQNRWRKILIYVCVSIHIALTTIMVIITFVQCSPPRALWDKVPGAKCWNPKVVADFTVAQSAFGTWMDFLLATVPCTIIWTLTLSTKTKIGLCILLSLGAVAGIFSALKTSHMQNYANRVDFTWAIYPIFMWAVAENSLIVIFGSIPPVKPLFDRWLIGKPVVPHGRGPSYNTPRHNDESKSSVFKNLSSKSKVKFLSTIGGSTMVEEDDTDDRRPIELHDRRIVVEHAIDVASQSKTSFSTEGDHTQPVPSSRL